MKIDKLMTEDAILVELGGRLAQHRLALEMPQAELAAQAGVSKRTVERIEAGATTQMSTMIRILRALNLFDCVETMVPDTKPGPMDLLKLKGKDRKRASRRKTRSSGRQWRWGDES